MGTLIVKNINGWYTPVHTDANGNDHPIGPEFPTEQDAQIWLGDYMSKIIVIEVRGGIAEVVQKGQDVVELIIDHDNLEEESK